MVHPYEYSRGIVALNIRGFFISSLSFIFPDDVNHQFCISIPSCTSHFRVGRTDGRTNTIVMVEGMSGYKQALCIEGKTDLHVSQNRTFTAGRYRHINKARPHRAHHICHMRPLFELLGLRVFQTLFPLIQKSMPCGSVKHRCGWRSGKEFRVHIYGPNHFHGH